VSDLSLRPLAEALGTSSRMLIYHFGTKERLLLEVVAAARARQYAMLEEWTAAGATLTEVMRSYWQWARQDASQPYLRLFFEVFGMAVQGRPGTDGVLEALSGDAMRLFGSLAQQDGADEASDELAMMAICMLRGALFQLLATGERDRLDGAMERFLHFLGAKSEPVKE
jgi:AcrR family transcriptional regulator